MLKDNGTRRSSCGDPKGLRDKLLQEEWCGLGVSYQ